MRYVFSFTQHAPKRVTATSKHCKTWRRRENCLQSCDDVYSLRYSKTVLVASCTLIRFFSFVLLVCGRWDGISLWFYFASPWLLIQLSIFSFAYEPLSVPSSMKRLLFFLLVWLFMVDLHKSLPHFDFSSLTVVGFANNLSQLEVVFLFSLWCLWWQSIPDINADIFSLFFLYVLCFCKRS